MKSPSAILTNDHDRASATAWGTLCILVAVQVGIVLWLLASPTPEEAALVANPSNTSPTAPAYVIPGPLPGTPAAEMMRKAPPAPGQISAPPVSTPAPVVSSNAPPPVGSFGTPAAPAPALRAVEPPPALPGAGMKPPPMPPTAAVAPESKPALPGSGMAAPDEKPTLPGSGVAPPDEKPPLPGSGAKPPSAAVPSAPPPAGVPTAVDPRRDVNGLLTSAKELRGLGNTQDALDLLQRADLVAPNHPAVMAEMAEVYEQMGLSTKAVDAWRSIQLQGAAKAGQYYELATRRLGTVPGAAATAPPSSTSAVEGDKRLRLGACQVQRDFRVTNGERYVLRVPIQRAGSKSIDPNAIDMKVFFYYRDSGSVKLDNITELTETWQTEPVDWSGAGDEIVDVTYQLPPPAAADIAQRGQKTYHGYMLHLYYDNKLQDVAGEPRDLLDAALQSRSQPVGGGDLPNPLLPPVGR
ncbi:MAG: hypothetical protein JNG86_22685 [Verrucomicrobiaceae bacterium]|nr:hypothetical protein [Verrucomicrobiaceae bacterium]